MGDFKLPVVPVHINCKIKAVILNFFFDMCGTGTVLPFHERIITGIKNPNAAVIEIIVRVPRF